MLRIVKTIKYAQNSYLEKISKIKNRPPGGAVDQSGYDSSIHSGWPSCCYSDAQRCPVI